MKKSIFQRALSVLAAAALLLCLAHAAAARQQGGTTRYIYDEDGRLHVVISPSGESVVYEYDAAGNLKSVRRLAADALAIFAFTPHAGIYGDLVTFVGSGFGVGVSGVSFNGTSARVVSATATTVVAEVPQGATTGLVTITTTPGGSVTTTQPFTIAGVLISPSAAVLNFAGTQQFTAQVLPSSFDQTVTWSVNDIPGGGTAVGTISPNGLYTAPSRELPSVVVRAVSVADPQRSAEARVRVRNPADLQGVYSASVAVSFGVNSVSGSVARPVSVQRGTVSDSRSSNSAAVSVQFGNPSGVSTSLSSNVSVQRGDASQLSAYTNPPVSVRYGSATEQDTAYSLPVTVTTGPFIQSITPAQIARGATVTVTLAGVNFAGANALRFINSSGINDTSITVTGLTVSPDGATLTATFAVGSGAALGRRIVVIVTPDGSSQIVDLGTNTVEVVAP